MEDAGVQELCERGQELLIQMEYLEAEAVLSDAADRALRAGEWDAVARAYLPLQEARRQRRQRCGEGTVCFDLVATSRAGEPDPEALVERYPRGQLLVAGWGSIAPALRLRRLAADRKLYLETYLAAAYPTENGLAIVIAPTATTTLPSAETRTWEALKQLVGPRCLLLAPHDLPSGPQDGTYQTYALTMGLWERLHLPFLQEADRLTAPPEKIAAYRRTIEVDYACELAHQNLAAVAAQLRQTAGTAAAAGASR